jgi:hypothetical protein
MFCASCGKENTDSSVFCSSCRQPLTGVAPIGPSTLSEPPKAASGNARKIIIAVVVLLVLTPFLIVFVRGFVQGFTSHLESTDQKVSRLMREAAGLQPVRTSIFGENQMDTRMREFFRNIIQFNKDYQAAAAKLDVSQTAVLSTPESFADPSAAAEALKQLHAAYDLDAQQEQKMQQLLDDFRRQIDTTSFSASDRQTFLNAFNQGLAQNAPKRQRAIDTEKEWLEANDDIYSYAEIHHQEFTLVNGHLSVNNDAVLAEFNSKVRTLNQKRQAFIQAKDAFDRLQNATWQKVGVTPDQTGLH